MCLSMWAVLSSCRDADYNLDKAIPRLQTPAAEMAWFRTKWRDGEHIETIYFDRQNRMVESFNFGLSSGKKLFFYKDSVLAKTIEYSHGDSDELNTASVDTAWYEYDGNAKLIAEKHRSARIPGTDASKGYKVFWAYTAAGDTVKKWEGPDYGDPFKATDVNRWERDDKQRIKSHYKLYIRREPEIDTSDYFIRRYAYDAVGKLKMVWFEHMYLGRYYSVPGADTVRYTYDAQNRLVNERHRYTTDMRNKQEVDTANIREPGMDYVRRRRKAFFEGETYSPRNDRVVIVEYRYEQFDPKKHAELAMPN